MNKTGFAMAVLQGLGLPTTSSNLQAMVAWENAEGGNWNNTASFNPLNTTQRMPGSSVMGGGNSAGVQAYTSWDQGIQATIQTLRNGNYGAILSAFRAGNSASAVVSAVVGSPWGTRSISLNGATVTSPDTSGGSSGGSVTTPLAQPKLDPATLATLYGLSSSLINSDKELKKLFGQAVQQQWAADVFVAHLKNTKWWSTQSDTMRQYVTLKYTDPATFSQKLSQTAFHVNQLAVAVGYGNLLAKGTTLGKMDPTLQNAVLKVMQNGWTDQQISAYLGGMVKLSNGEMAGQAGQDYDKLHTYAYANGLTQSPNWYLDQVRQIEGGKTTVDTVIAQLRQQAASKYSAYATQIQAGQNVLDLAAPYTKAVAQLLELPDGSVDLNNKYVEQAMTAKLPTGGMPGSQMPLWQFEDQVRNDPLWRKTDNARESTAQIARQVGQIFGQSI